MSVISGSDSFKLIKMIYTVAKNARVYKESCQEFAAYLLLTNNLLQPLQQSPQLIEHPAVQDALAMLQRQLVKAFLLIQKCEHTSTITAVIKHVPRQLKELEGEIQKVLSLLNLANLGINLHIATNSVIGQDSKEAGLTTYPELYNSTEGIEDAAVRISSRVMKGLTIPSTSYHQALQSSLCVSSKNLSITWGKEEKYWKWVERRGSLSGEVAYVVDVFWLEVQGQLDTRELRPGKYTLSWRLQVACVDDAQEPSGWDSQPVVFKLFTGNGRQATERSCYLGKKSENLDIASQGAFSNGEIWSKAETSNRGASGSSHGKMETADRWSSGSQNGKMGTADLGSSGSEHGKLETADLGSSSSENGKMEAADVGSLGKSNGKVEIAGLASYGLKHGTIEEEIEDEWMEYEVGTFTVNHDKQGSGKLTFSMAELNGSWKRGLFLDCVIITPCEGSGYESILIGESSMNASSLSLGGYSEEDFPTLPEKLTFSGHQHELKLMKDAYWFACGICEATEQGLGYRCHQCHYDVHPECCISDYEYSSLLTLTDSNHSHWQWENLLELHKHRTEVKMSRPKVVIFPGHPHRLKLTRNPHPSIICDSPICDCNGWVYRGWDCWTYRCGGCNFDLHPECRL